MIGRGQDSETGIEHIKEDFVVIGKDVLNYFIIGAIVERKLTHSLDFAYMTSRSFTCQKTWGLSGFQLCIFLI